MNAYLAFAVCAFAILVAAAGAIFDNLSMHDRVDELHEGQQLIWENCGVPSDED